MPTTLGACVRWGADKDEAEYVATIGGHGTRTDLVA